MSEGESGRRGERRKDPLRLLAAVAALLLFAFASSPGPGTSAAVAASVEVSAADPQWPSGSSPAHAGEECAAHLAMCGAMLHGPASATGIDEGERAADWVVLLPGSDRAPERNPPPPRLLS